MCFAVHDRKILNGVTFFVYCLANNVSRYPFERFFYVWFIQQDNMYE